jgi:hypothetical protein
LVLFWQTGDVRALGVSGIQQHAHNGHDHYHRNAACDSYGGPEPLAAVELEEEESLEQAGNRPPIRPFHDRIFIWFEPCSVHHIAKKTEPSKRRSASCRLPSRSGHRAQKPLSWSRAENSLFREF